MHPIASYPHLGFYFSEMFIHIYEHIIRLRNYTILQNQPCCPGQPTKNALILPPPPTTVPWDSRSTFLVILARGGERDNDQKVKPPRPSFPGGALVSKAAAGGAGTGAGGAGRWRAAVYEHQVFCPYEHSVNEHQLVTAASVGCTTRICTRAEAIQVWTNWNSVFLK